jgi:hypothetical protein
MHSTQLACPHCGSTLSFGTEIAAGTPVECLICMRTFTATNPIAIPTALPAKSAAPKSVPNALPAIPRNDKPTPTRLPAESTSRSSIALIVVTVGLLFLLTGGIVYAVWRITALARTDGAPPDETQIVDKGNNGLPTDPNKKKDVPPDAKNAANGGGALLVKADDEDDDLRAKFQEEVKQVLKRKVSSKPGGNEPEPEPVTPIDVPKPTAAGLTQKKIDAAIEKGITHLKRTLTPSGPSNAGNVAGHASLAGLTLLECKAPANDPAIQRAATYVRANLTDLDYTYEIALVVLFLDRLGDPRDRPLIQGLALRLMAGQKDCGGWDYTVPLLNPQTMHQLYTFMQDDKQPRKELPGNPARHPNMANDPFHQFSDLLAKNPAARPNAAMLDADLRKLQVVYSNGKAKGQMLRVIRGEGLTDNSNSQFALLALWAARRHGVPVDSAILAAHQRFMTSQNADGGWGYRASSRESTNTMTCVGLLGLALGHGASPAVLGVNPKNPKEMLIQRPLEDPAIQKGLQALARNIGQPSLDPRKTQFPGENLYFLWSVERVAVLYDLQTIGGKDWYGWGAQILVHNQGDAGNFLSGEFPANVGEVNTCFALLFLRRSNLVQDLTNRLRLQSGIRDPEP